MTRYAHNGLVVSVIGLLRICMFALQRLSIVNLALSLPALKFKPLLGCGGERIRRRLITEAMNLVRDFFSIIAILIASALMLMVMIPAFLFVWSVLYIIISAIASL